VIERLLIALVLIAAAFAAITLVRLWVRRRNRRIVERLRESATRHDEGHGPAGTPRIVYFTTKTCMICRTKQEPALERLRAEHEDVLIETYDAIEELDLAAEYGVYSAPTTAVYDAGGRLVTINRGFVDVDELMDQLGGSPRLRGESVAVDVAD
jgi:thiol-disulfide isomerase/thioredoxin